MLDSGVNSSAKMMGSKCPSANYDKLVLGDNSYQRLIKEVFFFYVKLDMNLFFPFFDIFAKLLLCNQPPVVI